MQAYLLALSFLTSLPVKINYIATREQLTNSLIFYPVVGFTLGGIIAGVAWLGNYFNLGIAGDVLAIITLVVLTAGLHLDGLMDTADGLFSGSPRAAKLEIMKDSNVGAMGAIALVSQLLLKIALVSVLVATDKYIILILMPATGRWAMVYGIANYPYARAKPGLGSIFNHQEAKWKFAWGTIILYLVGRILFGIYNTLAMVITFILVHFLAKGIGKSLGGQTGDTYGAIGEIAETVYLITAVLIISIRIGANF